LVSWKLLMPIGGDFQRIPRDKHRARLLFAVEPKQHVGKAQDGAGRLGAAPQDCFWKGVIGAVCEGITVDYQQRQAGQRRRPAMRASPAFRASSLL
jgi:hypothetical protein